MSRNGVFYADMQESIPCEILLFIGPRKKYGFAQPGGGGVTPANFG